MTLANNVNHTALPSYSRKQELFNAISHFIGIILAIIVLVFGITLFSNGDMKPLIFIGYIIFSLSMFTVYLISGIYHVTPKDSSKKRLLRIIDHCTIYLLIAGTYTPVCFSLFDMMQTLGLGIFMLSFEWIGAIIGIVLNAFFFNNKAANTISFILYVLMGWLAALCGAGFSINQSCFVFILLGGIVYTIGSILYAIGKKYNKWCHFIFHVFVLLGTIIQMMGIFYLH